MANFDQLKQSVAALIRTNGAEEITGQIMQDVLLTIINSISGGYMFGGVAQHSGNVGNPDYNVFYLAGSGAYTGYGGAITIEDGCYGVFRYNGTWHQEVVDIGVRLSGSIVAGETRGVTGDTINTALQTLFDNVMNILDSLTFTYNTPSAQQATKAMLDVIMTPTGGAPHVLTTLTLASATVAAAGLMSAEDKQKVDRMLTDFRSLSLTDTTAAADQATKIVQTLSATLGENPEVITTFTLLAATVSKAGLMSAADKSYLDSLPAVLTGINGAISDNLARVLAMMGYYECSTAAGTAAKVVSASGYALTSGGCIRIKMTNANTANNVTLNINSTGAKALYYDGERASSTNSWNSGDVLEVYYDGTQYQCASGGGGNFATGQKVKEIGITDEVDNSSNVIPTSKAVFDKLLKQVTLLFENSSSIQWQTGNVSNGTIVTTYANKYYRIPIPQGIEYIEYNRTTLDSSFNMNLFASSSASSGYVGIVGVNDLYKKVDVRGYSYLLLLCWDKPTTEQVQSIAVTITNTRFITELGISQDFFDDTQSNVPSMSIFNPMATNVYIEKLTTGNGIVWEQGGINGQTGVDESNTKAIRTNPIYLNGDTEAVVEYLTPFNSYYFAIAVYDEDGTFKVFSTTFTNTYPNGYVRFCIFGNSGSPAILPSRGAESGAYVIRRKRLEYRVSKLEQSVLRTYENPVYRHDFPDPTVWNGEDGYFYALSTGYVGTKTMLRSANLVDWEDTLDLPYTAAVAEAIETAIGGTLYWAPCVYKVNSNQWNMYLSKPRGGVLFLTSQYPTQGFEVVRMTTASFGDYIDADVARDRDGRLWMFAGSAYMMYRRQLTNDGLDFSEGSSWEHVAGRPANESGNVNRDKTFEGEYLYRHGGYWYLFCSSGKYDNNTYNIRVVRSATLDGTFVDKNGNLATDGYAERIMVSGGSLYGPGHNSQIIPDGNGKTWMLYHAHWSGFEVASNRAMCLSEVKWDEDGWPYFEGGVPNLTGEAPDM